MEFRIFLLAVFNSWVEKVGIILTLLPFIEKIPTVKIWLHDKPFLERFGPLLWIIGGLCMVWGSYSAWHTQYADNLKLRKEVAKLTSVAAITKKPDLRLSMSGGNVFTPDEVDVRAKFTGIALNVKVWNVGGPSVATDWSLFIIPRGGTPVIAQLTRIPGHLRLGGNINSAVISNAEALDQKTAETDITSVPIEGVLLFYAPVSKAVVQSPSTRWELSVKDIYGTESRVAQQVGNWLQR